MPSGQDDVVATLAAAGHSVAELNKCPRTGRQYTRKVNKMWKQHELSTGAKQPVKEKHRVTSSRKSAGQRAQSSKDGGASKRGAAKSSPVKTRFRMTQAVQQRYFPGWGDLDRDEKVHAARAAAIEYQTLFLRTLFLFLAKICLFCHEWCFRSHYEHHIHWDQQIDGLPVT